MLTSVLLPLVVLAAFSVEAVVGFGSTVLTVTIGAHLLPIRELLPAFVPLNLALSAVIVARDHAAVDRSLLLRRVLPYVGAGTVVGLAIYRLGDASALEVGLAVFVTALAVTELARLALREKVVSESPLSKPVAALLLGLGGVAHGLFGSGGPMVVYVASRELRGKATFRATLSALWLALNAVLVVNYAQAGTLSRSSLARTATLVPSLLVALLGGEWLHRKVPEARFRPIVYVVLLMGGLALGARHAR